MTPDLNDTIERWTAAERDGDTSALESLLADDFSAVGPRGFQLDKQGWVERYRSGSYRNEVFDFAEVTQRRYGDAAIVLGVQTNRGSFQGQSVGATCRCTQVYITQDGGWKLAALQLSEIAAPMAAPGR
ncbi:MAG TPA: nuclear transport factor 2 family protein [Dehalococcoidia bacterium]|nr:nuclear transport factor 2 family protein [Dehalococcoidia bacterium]